jgi:two-component system nitrogen regulation sensor histidine kinase NtrY
LIQNSLQSVPSNRKPQIGIQLVGEEKLSTLIITDNGNGIPEDIKEKIFEPKFTTKTAGMGLGLGIVKNIITSHGGSISYVSTPKKGTTFTILLPYI